MGKDSKVKSVSLAAAAVPPVMLMTMMAETAKAAAAPEPLLMGRPKMPKMTLMFRTHAGDGLDQLLKTVTVFGSAKAGNMTGPMYPM